MKKNLLKVLSVALFACSAVSCSTGGKEMVRMSYYDEMTYQEGMTKSTFNNNLFYRNDFKTDIADPGVTYISDKDSDQYGYYYMFGTNGSKTLLSFRSKDLENWEPMGEIFDFENLSTDEKNTLNDHLWAPEIIFDEDTKDYYLFFSGTPKNSVDLYLPFMAKAKNPQGPYQLIDNSSRYLSVLGSKVQNNYFNKYMTFDPVKMYNAFKNDESIVGIEDCAYMRSIDFHPFVDPDTKEKYLYFTCNKNCSQTFIMGMRMDSWEKPDYSTLTRITSTRRQSPTNDHIMSYEEYNSINEGAWVNKHNGKYYLTFSVNGYGDRSYSVGQAISDSPLGEFKKLEQNQGGLLLSTDGMTMDDVSGPGHHSLIERDGEMYIVYHKHNSVQIGGGARHVSVDRVKWVTQTDENNNQFDVMYCNGPTTSIQPRIDFAAEYTNVAQDAKITATNVDSESSVDYLNDGLLSIYRYANPEFVDKYIKETEFTKNTKITMSFEEPRLLRAAMIYNSKYKENAFYDIKKLEFTTIDENGKEKIKFIDHLQYDWNAYTSVDDVDFLHAGSAAIAEFNEIKVKKLEIEVDIASEEQIDIASGKLGISEIVLLGK